MAHEDRVRQSPGDSAAVLARRDLARFLGIRRRFYGGLLLFVVVAGFPIIAVPHLRQRLSARTGVLKAAIQGDPKPIVARVGENQGPLPIEFRRPEPVLPRSPKIPFLKKIYTTDRDPFPVTSPSRASRVESNAVRAGKQMPALIREEESTGPLPPESEAGSDLRYQKGKAEQDAYQLLLKSIPAVASMVRGSDSSLRFVSWDAANRGGDNYWVRLKFQSDGGPEIEYIWLVKLQSNQVVPLSHNARSIS